ncbi:mechanosensitive ion channel family protein [Dapis sp. BLCC M126]|uniref:mechanosensitive ion channel family protein n=1 Tax=Dapis sp. BLCC M126 TaxID=3400189 RepID=UPI003CEB715F
MKLKLRLVKIFFLALLTLLVLQTSLIANPVAKTFHPLAPPDTFSPKGTISSFVENINESYQTLMVAYEQYQEEAGLFPSDYVSKRAREAEILFKRAERCLNLSEIPSRLKQDKGLEATLMLKAIFDRIEIPTYNEIPDLEEVSADSKFSKWTIPNTEIDIVKVKKGVNTGEFLFSPETIARIEEFYKKVEALPPKPGSKAGFYKFYISTPGSLLPPKWLQIFPSWLDVVYWDQTLWQWIVLFISVLIGFLFPYKMFKWIWQRSSTLAPPRQTWELVIPPLITIVSLVAISNFLDEEINITGNILLVMLTTLEIIFWMMVALTIFLFSNGVAETIIISPKINDRGINASMIRIISRLLSLTIGTGILIIGIERVGISLIPIIAGLGIGGFAIALAAQSSLENLIAGLILLIDRPVKVGEYCRFGEGEGTVISIGLRSTRILSVEGNIISIPNAQLSQLSLLNESRRDRFLLNQTLKLSYDTTPEQIKFILAKLREIILAYPKVIKEGLEVRFVKYGDYSLDVEILAYVDTAKEDEFKEIQENLLLQVKDVVNAAGTNFAFR